MLKILFFGQLRERLQTENLSLDIKTLGSEPTVSTLRGYLSQSGSLWQELLDTEHCLVAVNQTMANNSTLLGSQDEVALFPPVTGG